MRSRRDAEVIGHELKDFVSLYLPFALPAMLAMLAACVIPALFLSLFRAGKCALRLRHSCQRHP